MDDLISRQAAIDALADDLSYYGSGDERAFGMSRAIGIIEKLPSAQPDNRLERIADIVEGTIDHLDRDDAMDMLYQIKEVLK